MSVEGPRKDVSSWVRALVAIDLQRGRGDLLHLQVGNLHGGGGVLCRVRVWLGAVGVVIFVSEQILHVELLQVEGLWAKRVMVHGWVWFGSLGSSWKLGIGRVRLDDAIVGEDWVILVVDGGKGPQLRTNGPCGWVLVSSWKLETDRCLGRMEERREDKRAMDRSETGQAALYMS
jgi:hypothetical protein